MFTKEFSKFHVVSGAEHDVLFSNGIRIDAKRTSEEPSLVMEGQYKGSYQSTLGLVTQVKGSIRRFTIDVFARSKVVAKQFLFRFKHEMGPTNASSRNILDLLNKLRREFEKEHQPLFFRYKSEVGKAEFVIFELSIGNHRSISLTFPATFGHEDKPLSS